MINKIYLLLLRGKIVKICLSPTRNKNKDDKVHSSKTQQIRPMQRLVEEKKSDPVSCKNLTTLTFFLCLLG